MAHELKTPLTIISGYIELLLCGKAGPVNDKQRQILMDASANCARLQGFVHDILTTCSIEAGRLVLRLEVRDLNACLSEACGCWLSRFTSKNVALYFPADLELPPFAFDYDKVQHIISNLLENSLKFTPPGGSVWLTTERHDSKSGTRDENGNGPEANLSDGAGETVKVTVADTGPGILPEYHLEIFEDFFRVPNQAGSSEGTGLGLGIARRLVLAHGGRIWVESEPGGGTRISFLLPMRSKSDFTDEHDRGDIDGRNAE